ncbi:peptidoglycan recognition protein [Streptomyces sp. NPDC046939]|uniref:peptidoglycan recognition protein family protein n=1 Tax=Streptomyces sp. NPDC046939 TaxID=3155376 RepID=UPI0033F0F741
MRAFLASSIGVTCAAALALPLSLPSHATPSTTSTTTATQDALAGSTQSLPLTPPTATPRATPHLPQRDVRPFSLVGVVWDDPSAELHGRVQVRTRATGTSTWSAWQTLETHTDDAPDPDAPERAAGHTHGSTAPLWVGDSDGVEVRVEDETPAKTRTTLTEPLPTGLRLDLVDPGPEPAQPTPTTPTASAPQTNTPPKAQTPTPETPQTPAPEDTPTPTTPTTPTTPKAPQTTTHTAPRPEIITRKGWGADEKLREKKLGYTKTVKVAFVHHSATGNNYTCAQAPSVIRSIYRYHVKSSGWRDIGYNFLVDKCGRIYEGRAGGVTKPVMGAHTLGFNSNSTGIAVLGSYDSATPPAAVSTALAKLTAWKLGLSGANPAGTTSLKSGGGNLYAKGKNVRLHVISGHRDGYATECPGSRLYKKLGTVRGSAARLQGR